MHRECESLVSVNIGASDNSCNLAGFISVVVSSHLLCCWLKFLFLIPDCPRIHPKLGGKLVDRSREVHQGPNFTPRPALPRFPLRPPLVKASLA